VTKEQNLLLIIKDNLMLYVELSRRKHVSLDDVKI